MFFPPSSIPFICFTFCFQYLFLPLPLTLHLIFFVSIFALTNVIPFTWAIYFLLHVIRLLSGSLRFILFALSTLALFFPSLCLIFYYYVLPQITTSPPFILPHRTLSTSTHTSTNLYVKAVTGCLLQLFNVVEASSYSSSEQILK